MRFAFCAVLAVLPFCLHAAVVVGQNDNNQLLPQDASTARAGRSDGSTAAASGNWAMAVRIASECAKDSDTAACLAVKTAAVLERAARLSGSVELFSGLVTVSRNADDAAAQRDSRSLPTEDELRGQLQPNEPDHTGKLTDMVVNSALRFLQSRTLQFKFPETNSEQLSRAIEEGERFSIYYCNV